MNLNENAGFEGLGLAELVKKREISPRELARTAKLAIDTADPIVHAVIETYSDRIDELAWINSARRPRTCRRCELRVINPVEHKYDPKRH